MRFTQITVFVFAGLMLSAQQPVKKDFSSASDVAAMVDKAKRERKADQANFIQQILEASPYRMNLEYRVHGIDTPPNIHEGEAEIVFVVEGAGVLTIGGTLKDERRTSEKNRSGSKVLGGTPRRIAKGDYIMIPEDTAHSFTEIEDRLVIASMHIPRGGAAH